MVSYGNNKLRRRSEQMKIAENCGGHGAEDDRNGVGHICPSDSECAQAESTRVRLLRGQLAVFLRTGKIVIGRTYKCLVECEAATELERLIGRAGAHEIATEVLNESGVLQKHILENAAKGQEGVAAPPTVPKGKDKKGKGGRGPKRPNG